MTAVAYRLSTGEVLGYVMRPDEESLLEHGHPGFGEGVGFLLGAEYSDTSYVVDGAMVPRPEMPVTQDGNTLTVPPNTKFEVYGPAELTGIAEDGVLEFEFSEPGTYTITLTNFPYLDTEVTLEG